MKTYRSLSAFVVITCTFFAARAQGASNHPQSVADRHVIAGHLHPCVRLYGGAYDSVRLPCFWMRSALTLLPAFGEFTGGAPIAREPGDTVVGVAEGRLYPLPSVVAGRAA